MTRTERRLIQSLPSHRSNRSPDQVTCQAWRPRCLPRAIMTATMKIAACIWSSICASLRCKSKNLASSTERILLLACPLRTPSKTKLTTRAIRASRRRIARLWSTWRHRFKYWTPRRKTKMERFHLSKMQPKRKSIWAIANSSHQQRRLRSRAR